MTSLTLLLAQASSLPGAPDTPYGVLFVALGLVATVVGAAMKLTSGSQTRGDNAFAAHLQTLVQDRDRALQAVQRAESRAESAEQEAHTCRRQQETQAREMLTQAQEVMNLQVRVMTLEAAMRAAGLTPPSLP